MNVRTTLALAGALLAALLAGVTAGVRGAHMIDRALGSDRWRRPASTGKAVR